MMLFAVIPTVGERNDTLFPMCRQLEEDGVTVIVVWNRPALLGPMDDLPWDINVPFVAKAPYLRTHYWVDEPVNLSAVWNMGLDWAHELAKGEDYVVAVFNDDLTLPEGIVQKFADSIQRTGAAAAYSAYWENPGDNFFDDKSSWHLGNRMIGYAFALRGTAGLRADEDFLWWWGDTDLDIRARQAGGVVAVQTPGLAHHDPNGYTNRNPALYEQAGRDRDTFVRKYGGTPW